MPFCSAWIAIATSRPGDRRLDLLAALADDDHALVGAERVDPVEQVQQHRPAGDRVQHLVRVGAHPRALPGGKDHDGETALVAHRREQWHGGVSASASAAPKRKRAAPEGAALEISSRREALEDVHDNIRCRRSPSSGRAPAW